jgi:hypothetical protein
MADSDLGGGGPAAELARTVGGGCHTMKLTCTVYSGNPAEKPERIDGERW